LSILLRMIASVTCGLGFFGLLEWVLSKFNKTLKRSIHVLVMVTITIATWIFVLSNSRFIFSECIGYGISLLTMPIALLFMSICNRFSKQKAEDETILVIYAISIAVLIVITVTVINRID